MLAAGHIDAGGEGMSKIVYISGPIHERIEFLVAEDYIFARGDIPVSINQMDSELGYEYARAMCDQLILECDSVYMLKGWEYCDSAFYRMKALTLNKPVEYQ